MHMERGEWSSVSGRSNFEYEGVPSCNATSDEYSRRMMSAI